MTAEHATQQATFAAGCFWGVEHVYRKHFGNGKGLIDARVGYTGGHTETPSYKAVCAGDTGHAEAVIITFDPATVSYRALVEFFFRMHDATSLYKQGRNEGDNYRSAIFYHDDTQKQIAEDVIAKANEQWFDKPIATLLVKAGTWWDAEDYHQLYLDKNPDGYHCESHYIRQYPPLK